MSIGKIYFVPAGTRQGYTHGEYRGVWPPPEERLTRHRVYLDNGGVEQLYFFETSEDAQHFWDEGYRRVLYLIDDGPELYPVDSMILWIDGKKVASRSSEAEEKLAD